MNAQSDTTSTTTTSTTTAMAQGEQSVEVGWGQYIGKVKGSGTMVLVILAGSLYFVTLLLLRTADAPVAAIEVQSATQTKEHDKIAAGVAEHKEMNAREHASLIRTQERIADSLDEQVFYLSKTESERANYRIEMPDSLQRKLVERGMRQNDDRPTNRADRRK